MRHLSNTTKCTAVLALIHFSISLSTHSCTSPATSLCLVGHRATTKHVDIYIYIYFFVGVLRCEMEAKFLHRRGHFVFSVADLRTQTRINLKLNKNHRTSTLMSSDPSCISRSRGVDAWVSSWVAPRPAMSGFETSIMTRLAKGSAPSFSSSCSRFRAERASTFLFEKQYQTRHVHGAEIRTLRNVDRT